MNATAPITVTTLATRAHHARLLITHLSGRKCVLGSRRPTGPGSRSLGFMGTTEPRPTTTWV